jgi:predicted SAM-dependent methyltransferase
MKLHLGCGPRVIPGWVHVDVADYPHVQLRHEVDALPMISEGTIEVVYACHVLEHFLRREVPRVLREWHRVLQPGGTLRLSVPDFAALVEVYRKTGALGTVIGPLFGRQDHLYNFHHTVFDFEALRADLTSAGFVNVHRYDWATTEHAHVDDYAQAYYPHLDRKNGILISLNVEAVKP